MSARDEKWAILRLIARQPGVTETLRTIAASPTAEIARTCACNGMIARRIKADAARLVHELTTTEAT